METEQSTREGTEASSGLFEDDGDSSTLGEQVCLKGDSPNSPGHKSTQEPSQLEADMERPDSPASGRTKTQTVSSSEDGHESPHSPVSDSRSSPESVCEKAEPPKQASDFPIMEFVDDKEVLRDDLSENQFSEPNLDSDLKQKHEFSNPEALEKPDYDQELMEYQAESFHPQSILDIDPELALGAESYLDLDIYPGHVAGDPGDVPDYLQEDQEEYEILFPPSRDESNLEQRIREDIASDISNSSVHELDPEDMADCLTVEDNEDDNKWRTIFSSSINKEDDDSYFDSLNLSAQELFVKKVEVNDLVEDDQSNIELCLEEPQVEEFMDQPDKVLSIPVPSQEVQQSPMDIQSLSETFEDKRDHGRVVSQSLSFPPKQVENDNSSIETGKKVPKDFCVIQETKSENVSTEHVDFQLARKQWREMEQQTKNMVIQPSTRRSTLQTSHSFMCTPVRGIERPIKKGHNLDNLHLSKEYSNTEFSPCSEDSGLGDSSCRSPYEDAETPVEKEIRLSIEREESYRRERGLSRMGKSTDCAPSRGMPRSISTPLTPSFIITSSPTKEPLECDVSAQNVIIVDPASESSPKLGKDLGACSLEWRSEDHSPNVIILETSNLIIRSASEYSLNKVCEQPEEKMFLNNPFFKLRSRSSISLVDEEIKQAKQREEELRKEQEERAALYGKPVKYLSNHKDTLSFETAEPVKCKSSPSSPMKTAFKMDRSVLSCDHRFPEAFSGVRRKSAMALRWEAGEFNKD